MGSFPVEMGCLDQSNLEMVKRNVFRVLPMDAIEWYDFFLTHHFNPSEPVSRYSDLKYKIMNKTCTYY